MIHKYRNVSEEYLLPIWLLDYSKILSLFHLFWLCFCDQFYRFCPLLSHIIHRPRGRVMEPDEKLDILKFDSKINKAWSSYPNCRNLFFFWKQKRSPTSDFASGLSDETSFPFTLPLSLLLVASFIFSLILFLPLPLPPANPSITSPNRPCDGAW